MNIKSNLIVLTENDLNFVNGSDINGHSVPYWIGYLIRKVIDNPADVS
jgi:hypothetical protein